jgi:hypothetical protein
VLSSLGAASSLVVMIVTLGRAALREMAPVVAMSVG